MPFVGWWSVPGTKKKKMIQTIEHRFPDLEYLKIDGYDDAILGLDIKGERLVYSTQKIVDQIYHEFSIWDEKFTKADAFEYFNFNIFQAYCGPRTPLLVYDVDDF